MPPRAPLHPAARDANAFGPGTIPRDLALRAPMSTAERYTPPWATLACWTVAVLAIAAGAAAACPDGACRAPAADRWLLEAFHAARQPWLDAFFAAFTWLGSIVVLLPASLALGWAWRRRGDRSSAWRLPLAVGGAWLLAHAGKLLVTRPRPDLHAPVISMPADLSFPSSHAMVAAAFAVALALSPRPRPSSTVVAAAALAALVVALSRMYLQVHYPSDVVAGAVAGTAWALGLFLLPGVRR